MVTGCSAQRDPRPYAAIAGVRLVAGNSHKESLLELVTEPPGSPAGTRVLVGAPAGSPPSSRVRSLLARGRSSNARAYLRVQDGCGQACSFCALPSVRGTSASLPLTLVREEARALAGAGHGEIVLTGAHLGSYGCDLEPRVSLVALVESVLEAAPSARVRLSSLEPRFLSHGLVGLLASERRLCPHLHLPLQSGDDRVLERMGRAYRSGSFARRALAAVEAVRAGSASGAPGPALGSDFMVGFPGEDDEAFAATVALAERLPFTYGHVFPYSERPGTAASDLPGRVRPEVARRRGAVLRRLLAGRNLEFRCAHVGQVVEIVVEEVERSGVGGLHGADSGAQRSAGPDRPDGAEWIVRGTSERFLPVLARVRGAAPRVASRLRVSITRVADEGLLGLAAGAP